MKKYWYALIVAAVLVGIWSGTAAASVAVVAEGPSDQYPHYLQKNIASMQIDGRAWLPLRAIAEELGFIVIWNPYNGTICIEGNGRTVLLQPGNQLVSINSRPFDISTAPVIIDDHAIVEPQFFAECLGFNVESSYLWQDIVHIYITPFTLINDRELTGINDNNFDESSDALGFKSFTLKQTGNTPAGIEHLSSILDVLQVYGVPQGPFRTRNYPADWSGKLTYWGSFIPLSDVGTFWTFTFKDGALMELIIDC